MLFKDKEHGHVSEELQEDRKQAFSILAQLTFLFGGSQLWHVQNPTSSCHSLGEGWMEAGRKPHPPKAQLQLQVALLCSVDLAKAFWRAALNSATI